MEKKWKCNKCKVNHCILTTKVKCRTPNVCPYHVYEKPNWKKIRKYKKKKKVMLYKETGECKT